MGPINSAGGMGFQALMNALDSISNAIDTQALSTPGLAIGTGATTAIKIVSTTTYKVAGIFKSKTTAEVAFTATTMDIPANAASVQEAIYVVLLDASGTITLSMGAIATGSGNAVLPERPIRTLCPIGYVRIAVAAAAPGSGTNFVAGTTALSDGRLTVTYYNGYPNPLFAGSAQ